MRKFVATFLIISGLIPFLYKIGISLLTDSAVRNWLISDVIFSFAPLAMAVVVVGHLLNASGRKVIAIRMLAALGLMASILSLAAKLFFSTNNYRVLANRIEVMSFWNGVVDSMVPDLVICGVLLSAFVKLPHSQKHESAISDTFS